MKPLELSKFTYFPVEEGVSTACRIPIPVTMKIEMECRCPKEVVVNLITGDGETILLDTGKIVRYRGKVEAIAVEIVADTSFWYMCHKSQWFEVVDPVPFKVEIAQTETDVLRSMIDERLRAYKAAMEINRELTEDEKDNVILDIIHGDLEFDDVPDEFGLGYEERLAEFARRTAEQDEAAPAEPAPPASSVGNPSSAVPAAVPNSSST